MEFTEYIDDFIHINVKLLIILKHLWLLRLVLLLFLFVLAIFSRYFISILFTFLGILKLLIGWDLLFLLLLHLNLLLVSIWEFVESHDKEFNIIHVINTKRLSDRINLNCKLILDQLVHAFLNCLVINKEGAFFNKKFKDIFNLIDWHFVFLLLASCDGLVIDELRLWHSVLWRIHNGGVWTHLTASSSPASVTALALFSETKDGISWWLPGDT